MLLKASSCWIFVCFILTPSPQDEHDRSIGSFILESKRWKLLKPKGLEICDLVLRGNMVSDNEAFGDLITNNFGDLITNNTVVDFQVLHTFMEYMLHTFMEYWF